MEQHFKAGIFVLGTLLLLVYITIRISQSNLLPGSTYPVTLTVDSALGLSQNTPVQIAGVDIGTVAKIELSDDSRARLTLAIDRGVAVATDAQGVIKTTGLLGDAIVEIVQHSPVLHKLEPGGEIRNSRIMGDMSSVTSQIGDIADDIKAITKQMKKLMAGDDSSFAKTMKNIETITDSLSKVTTLNEKNINTIIANVKALSQNLNLLVANNMGKVNSTVYNIDAITGKVAKGEGTVGRLINDEETVDKLNDALDGLNDFLGGTNKLRVDFGMHSEYLGGNSDFKNYVSLALRPRPDKYFLFEVTSDPSPSAITTVEETTVESGGATTSFTTTKRVTSKDTFRFSAQMAKKFQDFTIRGGLIESTGGVGVEYDKGPFGLEFSAFDFKSDAGQRPHLKAMGTANITHNVYLLGGVDDFINRNQDLDWFIGAGMAFTDDDIKSILGLLSAGNIGK